MNQLSFLNKIAAICLCVFVYGTSFSQSSTTLIFDSSIHMSESCVATIRPQLNNGLPAPLVLTARSNIDNNDELSLNATGSEGKLFSNNDGWGVKDSGNNDGCGGSGGISGGGGDKDEEITITFDEIQLSADVTLIIGDLDFYQDEPVVFVSTISNPAPIVINFSELETLETSPGTLELGSSSQLTSVTDISSITFRETDGHTYLEGIGFMSSGGDDDDDGDDDDGDDDDGDDDDGDDDDGDDDDGDDDDGDDDDGDDDDGDDDDGDDDDGDDDDGDDDDGDDDDGDDDDGDDDDGDDDDDDDDCPDGWSYCGEGTTWDSVSKNCVCVTSCYGDLFVDGHIQLKDLLELLGVYGTFCD